MFPRWKDWDITYTPKGLKSRRVKAFFKTAALLALTAGVLTLIKSGRSLKAVLQDFVRLVLLRGSNVLQGVAAKV